MELTLTRTRCLDREALQHLLCHRSLAPPGAAPVPPRGSLASALRRSTSGSKGPRFSGGNSGSGNRRRSLSGSAHAIAGAIVEVDAVDGRSLSGSAASAQGRQRGRRGSAELRGARGSIGARAARRMENWARLTEVATVATGTEGVPEDIDFEELAEVSAEWSGVRCRVERECIAWCVVLWHCFLLFFVGDGEIYVQQIWLT